MRTTFRAVFARVCLLLVVCASVASSTSKSASEGGEREIIRLAPDVQSKMLDASFWVSRASSPHSIIMTKAQIAQWNEQIMQQSMAAGDAWFFVHDLRRFDAVATSLDVRRFMIRYSASHPWYKKQGGETHRLTSADWRKLYDAMNFAPLGDFTFFSGGRRTSGVEQRDFPVRKAVTVRRSDLRLVPDDTLYTDDETYWFDDSAQTSGVLMNEPVLVLWESADKSWLYVRTNYCAGWIHRDDVAYCTDEQFARYFDYTTQEQSGFVTVTADRATLSADYVVPTGDKAFGGIPELFMGTYLHTVDWSDERVADSFSHRKPYACYIVEIPYRKADGALGIAHAAIPAGLCTEGLLDYTTANVLEQAFKPLGVRYGWGGMADARDCSEYLKDIYRCFGFMLPRNSRSQLTMPGKTVAFEGKNVSSRKSAVSSLKPGAVMGFPGHVFMYLGKVGGKHYIINAVGAYYFDDPETTESVDVNSVNVNTLDIKRSNGKTWLENLTYAKSFVNDGTFKDFAVPLNPKWDYADFAKITDGAALLYRAPTNRRNIVVAVNAGHGTKGGTQVKTYSHPDKSPKLTSGTSPRGAVESIAVSAGVRFTDKKSEAEVVLRTARLLRAELLKKGFDVLMLRDGDDVQLDNVARTVISNNVAAIHIAIHFDEDDEKADKGCFYCTIPEELRALKTVKRQWKESDRLGQCLVEGLRGQGLPIYKDGTFEQDLTQTSYSTIPIAVIELGNQHTKTDTESLEKRAKGLADGVTRFFAQ